MNVKHKQSLRFPRNRGFTLIEIMVVLAIIALMLALVTPRLGHSIDHGRIKSATRQLAAGLKLARIEAINSRKETTLVLDTEHRTYKLDGVKKELSLPKAAGLLLTTAQSEQLDEHTGAIRFFSDGSSTGGQIKLSMQDRFKYLIDVNWLTGKVTVTP